MRTISEAAKAINKLTQRQPLYKLTLWDLRSTGAPDIDAVIFGNADTDYSLDVTEFVQDPISLTVPGDRRADQLSFSLVADDDRFNPRGGSQSRFIKELNVVVLEEGDLGLAESEWVTTFTGHIRGQAGWSISRNNLERVTQLSAYGRRATPLYNKMTFQSKNYGRRVDYGTIVEEIARQTMQLGDAALSRLPGSLGRNTQFASNQVVEMTPLEAIDKILEAVGLVSDFDGAGKLRLVDRDVTRSEDKRYSNLALIPAIRIPQADVNTYNEVDVIGLDKNLTEVETPDSELARINMTVGFWRPKHAVKAQWSQDRSTRAKDTYVVIEQSVLDTLILGIGSEEYVELDNFSGQVEVDITLYLAILMALILVTQIAQSLIGDTVVSFGGGLTIPLGKVLQGITLKLITQTLSTVSSGAYLIKGTVLTPVYKEISVVTRQDNVPDYLRNAKEVHNDWINEFDHLLEIAQLELLFEITQGEPREFEVVNDWELEIGDIVYLPYGGGLRIWVDSFSKNVSRGEVSIMRVTGYRAF